MIKFFTPAVSCICLLSFLLLPSPGSLPPAKEDPSHAAQAVPAGFSTASENTISDLLHRDYGETAIKAQKNTILSFTLEDSGLSPAHVRGVYVHHFETARSTKLASTLKSFEYKVPEAGNYMIYLLTDEEGLIDISSYMDTGIEADINMDAETGGGFGGNGFSYHLFPCVNH